ncbi:gamma-glutamylcyclotransferase [Kocuria palustris]|uniref:gamma-glutamylcyclotransferase family protein n=1 Tax=Kocuria palustris TaxID=71999 RepID=UPI00119EB2E2|nr:gamma-glutamylcyclotransferase family protein [Kocuria palustris]
MSSSLDQRVFIYGTLAPGQPNEHVMEPMGGTWQRGIVRGRLLDRGWGAATGHPGIELDEAGEPVKGWLLTSPRLARSWQEMDDFEGDEYLRTEARVELDDGTETTAWIYALRDARS